MEVRNSNLGKHPFLGKTFFDFWGKLTPKNACPFGYPPTFSISSRSGSLGVVLPSHFFLLCTLLHVGGYRKFFLTIIHPCWGSLKWLGVSCVWNSCFWVCDVCFPSCGHSFSSFPSYWEFILVMICGWVSSPTIWMQFPIVFQTENHFW